MKIINFPIVGKMLKINRKLLYLSRFFSSKTATVNNIEPAKKTALYDFHIKNKGKMVNFCNFMLPVKYDDQTIIASHLHTRKHASIFDVSHMLQTYVNGKDAIDCIESICTADIKGLPNGGSTLTIFTNENGGIYDDLIITKVSSNLLYIVSNAGCRDQDKNLIQNSIKIYQNRGRDVSCEFFEPTDLSLLAFQGPEAVKILQKFTNIDLSYLYFMTSQTGKVIDINDCRITRCGYTGEDGFELSIKSERVVNFIDTLLNDDASVNVKLAGLGARDSLRLEAGLCLYGSDIDQTTTPVEANLSWLIAKRRRSEMNFPGAKKIMENLKNGCSRRRIGLRSMTGPPLRPGCEIYSLDHERIGLVTSGCPSPSLGGNIGMGYVLDQYKKVGNEILIKIRDKYYKVNITKMPFTQTNYYVRVN